MFDHGAYGVHHFTDVVVEARIDTRHGDAVTAATMFHELIEAINTLNCLGLKHEDIDKLAEPLAGFARTFGFSTKAVFGDKHGRKKLSRQNRCDSKGQAVTDT
jgi:hypothetical protein